MEGEDYQREQLHRILNALVRIADQMEQLNHRLSALTGIDRENREFLRVKEGR